MTKRPTGASGEYVLSVNSLHGFYDAEGVGNPVLDKEFSDQVG